MSRTPLLDGCARAHTSAGVCLAASALPSATLGPARWGRAGVRAARVPRIGACAVRWFSRVGAVESAVVARIPIPWCRPSMLSAVDHTSRACPNSSTVTLVVLRREASGQLWLRARSCWARGSARFPAAGGAVRGRIAQERQARDLGLRGVGCGVARRPGPSRPRTRATRQVAVVDGRGREWCRSACADVARAAASAAATACQCSGGHNST
jgi:hypothetical protein